MEAITSRVVSHSFCHKLQALRFWCTASDADCELYLQGPASIAVAVFAERGKVQSSHVERPRHTDFVAGDSWKLKSRGFPSAICLWWDHFNSAGFSKSDETLSYERNIIRLESMYRQTKRKREATRDFHSDSAWHFHRRSFHSR